MKQCPRKSPGRNQAYLKSSEVSEGEVEWKFCSVVFKEHHGACLIVSVGGRLLLSQLVLIFLRSCWLHMYPGVPATEPQGYEPDAHMYTLFKSPKL